MRKDVSEWVKKIEEYQESVAFQRDKLDEAMLEMDGLRESCDRAWHDLQSARDALSELV